MVVARPCSEHKKGIVCTFQSRHHSGCRCWCSSGCGHPSNRTDYQSVETGQGTLSLAIMTCRPHASSEKGLTSQGAAMRSLETCQEDDMARFSMQCPLCRRDFTVGVEDFGRDSSCPSCFEVLRIPGLCELERQADFTQQQQIERNRLRHSADEPSPLPLGPPHGWHAFL